MWSFEDQYEFFQSQAQDQDDDHLTLGKKTINLGNKKLETELGMPPQEEERTYTTTSASSYALPERFIRLIELYVTISNVRHYATPVYGDGQWAFFKRQSSGVTSDILTHVFVRPGLKTFEIYPAPSTAGYTMTMIYESFSKDLSAADYVTGNITTLANLGTAVTGSNTVFTAAMVGRWFKINSEGNWYKISGYTSATAITLQMAYQGAAIAAGTEEFTIGEIPRIPEGTHDIPVNFALWQHFAGVRRDPDMAKYYKNLWDEGKVWAKEQFGSRYASAVIPSQRRVMGQGLRDPNNYPDLSGA